MRRYILLLLAAALSLFGGEVRVAAAANAGYALEDIARAFEKEHPATKIAVTIGSSGKLAAQILHGAPYDLFLSANMSYPQRLYREGAAVTKPRIYAKGVLILFSIKDLDLDKGVALLKDPAIRTVAVANPKTAPYGAAAAEALERSGVYDEIKRKLVYGESVAQTLAYALKAADVGLVAKSALHGAQMQRYRERIKWKDVERGLYTPIAQGAVLLARGQKNEDAKAFYAFLFSKSAKKIFEKYGYLTK